MQVTTTSPYVSTVVEEGYSTADIVRVSKSEKCPSSMNEDVSLCPGRSNEPFLWRTSISS